MKKISFVFVILTIFSCHHLPPTEIKVDELLKVIEEPNTQILDVRNFESFKKGHIDKSLNIDLSSLKFDSLTFVLYNTMPVYVIAENDNKGLDAVKRLNILGFRDARFLKGGIQAWTNTGNQLVEYQVEQPKKIYESDTIPFLEARKGSKLVMVDFNATWCKPCKMLAPAVEKAHNELADDVIVYSIDTDEHPELAREYMANSIPLLVFIKNGQEVHRSVGLISEQELFSMIQQYK